MNPTYIAFTLKIYSVRPQCRRRIHLQYVVHQLPRLGRGLDTHHSKAFDHLAGETSLFTNTPSLLGCFGSLLRRNNSDLSGNDLAELPAGVFDDLTSLTSL